MSEHFLISDSLKNSLSKETLYLNVNDRVETVPILLEVRNLLNEVELDMCFNDHIFREIIELSRINFNEVVYDFKKTLSFNVRRIFFNEAKSILYTIVIDKEEFWSNL